MTPKPPPPRNPATAMWSAILLFSIQPLVVALTEIDAATFWFLYSTGSVILWLAYIRIYTPELLKNKNVYKFLHKQTSIWDTTLSIFNGTYILFFVWSTNYIHTTITTIIYTGAFTLGFVFLRQRHDSTTQPRYRIANIWEWTLLTASATGAALVILSELNNPTSPTHGISPTLLGVTLAAMAAFSSACVAHRFKIGTELHNNIARTDDRKTQTEISCHILVSTLATIISVPVIAATGFLTTEQFKMSLPHNTETLTTGTVVLTLSMLTALGSILFRYANLTTRSLTVNAISFATPALSLGWLWLITEIDVPKPDYLWIGVAGVLTTNTLLQLRATKHRTYPNSVSHHTLQKDSTTDRSQSSYGTATTQTTVTQTRGTNQVSETIQNAAKRN